MMRGEGQSTISMELMTCSVTGRSFAPVGVVAMASTTRLDSSSVTLPKMVWLPSSHGVGATVMKNWEPLVPRPMRLPALAMASR